MLKPFVLAATLFLAACTTVNVVQYKPVFNVMFETSAKLTTDEKGDESFCSATVVAPGKAVTAKHCRVSTVIYVQRGGVTYEVESEEFVADADADRKTLIVPGLPCPCAELAETPAVKGETAFTAGYPGGWVFIASEGLIWGRADDVEFDWEQQETYRHPFIVSSTHAARGLSGGGLYVLRNGKPYLVGVVSRGATSGMPLMSEELPLKGQEF